MCGSGFTIELEILGWGCFNDKSTCKLVQNPGFGTALYGSFPK